MAGKDEYDADQETEREYRAYLEQIETFEAPPENFEPFRAESDELARYGYPRRPDSETEPHLVPLWEKAMRRPLKPVRAELEIDRVLLGRNNAIARAAHDGRFVPTGWGGIVAQTSAFNFSPPEPANMVYGEWMVPTMEPDFDNPRTPMTVGFWVGLDGYGSSNNQVLQAGTAATVTGDNIDYWAWFEWYPAPPVRMTNFPIAAGDLVTVLVCAPAPNRGFASMLNRTTGVVANVGFPPPGNITSQGMTAEWVVEGISDDLPQFTLVGFHKCVAGTKTHRIDLSRPTEIEIAGVSGDLTVAVDWLPDTVLVLWEGYR